jgi:rod shape determining protein RodA
MNTAIARGPARTRRSGGRLAAIDLPGLLRHVDYVLLAITLALLAYGATAVYYATSPSTYYLRQQLIYGGFGLVVMMVVSLVDYEHYRRWQWLLYGFTVFSIAAVFVIGPVTRGSRRWINLGIIPFQPSELAIVLLIVALGAFLVDRLDMPSAKRLTALTLALVVPPALMVFLQPDLGTATVLVVLCLALLFFYGTRWTHLVTIIGGFAVAIVLVLAVVPALGLRVLSQYQVDRLTVFLDPTHDTSSAGYNITESLIAVGSGGLTGRGNQSTQTSLQFLPEHHTDFIFAVAGERWGFMGASLLILLYALLIWRALRIAAISRDMYGSVMAGTIATVFLYQMLVNVGMTIGIMPVTGVPLPFISYGGAALTTSLMLIGLLESIHVRARHAMAVRDRVL